MNASSRVLARRGADRVYGSASRELPLNDSGPIGHNPSIPLNTRSILIQAMVLFGLRLGVAQAAEDSQAALLGAGQGHGSSVLCVQITGGPQVLDADAVRKAIEKELGITTSSVATPASVGTVRVEPGNGAFVTVRYESADGGTQLKRRMALPVDASRRVTVIAWVVGNLVRNEADEILLAMMNRRESTVSDHAASSTSSDALSDSAASGLGEPEATQTSASAATTPKEQPNPKASKAPSLPVHEPFKPAATPDLSPDLGPTRFFHAALFSPSLAWPADAAQRAFRLSLGGVYGQVGALDGVGLSWFVNRVEYHSSGVQISGLWIDGNEHAGALLAGLVSHSRGALNGAELSGLVTWRSGTVVGAQVAGIGTYAGQGLEGTQIAGVAALSNGRSSGAQVSGVFSYSASDVKGVQCAGAVNIAHGDLHGLQLSGGVNYQGKHSRGAQITGAVNVANDVDGLQMGLLNVARDVDGLQLGVVNVARHNRGIALGLFNWSDGARLQPTYFFQTPGYHNAGYRTISGYSTGTISFGYDPSAKRARTHFATGPRYAYDRFAISAEFGYGWVLENMSGKPSDRAHELDLIGTVSSEVVRNGVSLYAGGGVVLPVAGVVAIEPRGLAQLGISLF